MKLTKSERHTAYIIFLYEILNGGKQCLCFIMEDVSGIHLSAIRNEVRYVFPEYWKNRDKKFYEVDGAFYFETKEKRIAALKQCIKETV